MRILVLGGTRFVGRHIVEAALAREHEVAVFNRGRSAPGLFGGTVQELRGDRMRDELGALHGRTFDATVDVSGYQPEEVERVLAALGDGTGRYAFVSSVSVYVEPVVPGSDEEAAVLDRVAPGADLAVAYGASKVRCERALPTGALVVRPGVVAGPQDPTERVTRWARRAAVGDLLLAADADQPVQFIDARDLAAFLLDGVERGVHGTFNVVTEPVPFSVFLAAAGADRNRVVWAGTEWLNSRGVELWGELPLTATPRDAGFCTFSSARARTVGLHTRPLAETLADVHAWVVTRSPSKRSDPLPRERETALLAALKDSGRLAPLDDPRSCASSEGQRASQPATDPPRCGSGRRTPEVPFGP